MHPHLKCAHLSNSSPYSKVFIDSICMLTELFLRVLRFCATFVCVCVFFFCIFDKVFQREELAQLEETNGSSQTESTFLISDVSSKIQYISRN